MKSSLGLCVCQYSLQQIQIVLIKKYYIYIWHSYIDDSKINFFILNKYCQVFFVDIFPGNSFIYINC